MLSSQNDANARPATPGKRAITPGGAAGAAKSEEKEKDKKALAVVAGDDAAIGAVTPALIEAFRQQVQSDVKNRILTNALCTVECPDFALSRDALIRDTQPAVFSVQLPEEGKITNQKRSGRCWLFAATNVLRLAIMQYKGLEEFELSQSYLFFWDRFEKANYFLEAMIELRGEPLDSRLVQYLLHPPTSDGGQFDMVVNLVVKHGLVPKTEYPESASSESSAHVNFIVNLLLRRATCRLRQLHQEGAGLAALRAEKHAVLSDIYRVLSVNLGPPPATFSWSTRTKSKALVRTPPLSPLQFAQEFLPPMLQMEAQVSCVNDPRNPYHRLYTVDYLGNVVGGRPVLYCNVPIAQLKALAVAALQKGKPVWFGCDSGKYLHRTRHVFDPALFDFSSLYGIDLAMSKADRLRTGESLMTHAMVFTGVDLDEQGAPTKWRVANSWGTEHGDKGFALMSDAWFEEFVYQIVCDRNDLPAELRAVFTQTPVRLPAWDPMGSLARPPCDD